MPDMQRGAPCSGEAGVTGVVIVTFRAGAFIGACLESLFAAGGGPLRVVVVDNASPDGTVAAIRAWANGAEGATADERSKTERREDAPSEDVSGRRVSGGHGSPAQGSEGPCTNGGDSGGLAPWPFAPAPSPSKPVPLAEWSVDHLGGGAPCAPGTASGGAAGLTLLHAPGNLGFAGGVNLGLAALRQDPTVDLFWVLNPDTVVPPGTPAAFRRAAAGAGGAFGLMGGRVRFLGAPERIHTDGGRTRPWRAGTISVHLGRQAETTALPAAETLDFISGASMVASRAFLDRAGPMEEGYFLYCEEIDWARRRGDLPLLLAPGAEVYHRGGASIGSGSGTAVPSPLSAYWHHRSLMRLTARWHPWWLPTAYALLWLQIGRKLLARRAWGAASAALRGLHGGPPPRAASTGLRPRRRPCRASAERRKGA